MKYFNDWTEEVKRTVPKERLLVFQAKQGWKPLCEFLGLPVPDGEFPRYSKSDLATRHLGAAAFISREFVLPLLN